VEQGKEQCGVTVDGGASCRAGAAGHPTKQEQAGSPSTCRAGLSSPPFLIQPGATKEMDADTIIKNEQAQSIGILG